MNYKKYFLELSKEAQDNYAVNAGTTGTYLRTHIFVSKSRRKIPRPDLIERLSKATNGKASMTDVLAFLYQTDIERAA
jgi:fatty acid/phospholipid biosynthesis enzyme